MDATQVDWSMGSQAARLADWDLGPRSAGASRARGPAWRRPIALGCGRTSRSSSRRPRIGSRSSRGCRPVVSSPGVGDGKGEWIRANLGGLQRMLEPLAGRILASKPGGTFRRKTLGVQAGALLGYVSRRVLGQYDAFLPPDDEGLLYFVGPNGAEGGPVLLAVAGFPAWVAVHEVTHRVQFGSAPWLRGYIREQVDRTSGRSPGLEGLHRPAPTGRGRGAQRRRPPRDGRAGSAAERGTASDCPPRAGRDVPSSRATASYVMNEVAREHVRDLDRMRSALAERRRRAGGVERSFQRAIGFDKKIEQYDAGERFVRDVVARVGIDGFNGAWLAAEALPTVEDIAEPATWVARVAGS